MSFQGISRQTPPVCTGQGRPSDGDHCCYVDGQVCPLYVSNDPRDTRPGAVHSCGLILDLQEQFPQLNLSRLWDRVLRHPLYAQIQEVWDRVGIVSCGAWTGAPDPDNPDTIIGQCCFEGYTFDLEGNVLTGPG